MKTSDSKVPKWVEEYRRKETEFWGKTYPAKTWEEQVDHWVKGISDMMQASETSGADPYEGFNPEAYAAWKAQEPRIDAVLDLVAARLPGFDRMRMAAGIQG